MHEINKRKEKELGTEALGRVDESVEVAGWIFGNCRNPFFALLYLRFLEMAARLPFRDRVNLSLGYPYAFSLLLEGGRERKRAVTTRRAEYFLVRPFLALHIARWGPISIDLGDHRLETGRRDLSRRARDASFSKLEVPSSTTQPDESRHLNRPWPLGGFLIFSSFET